MKFYVVACDLCGGQQEISTAQLRKIEVRDMDTRACCTADLCPACMSRPIEDLVALTADGPLEKEARKQAAASAMVQEQDGEPASVTAIYPPPDRAALLDRPVSLLDLTTRPGNCLRREGVFTLGDLVALTEQELSDIRNMGEGSVREVTRNLDAIGLQLTPAEDDTGGTVWVGFHELPIRRGQQMAARFLERPEGPLRDEQVRWFANETSASQWTKPEMHALARANDVEVNTWDDHPTLAAKLILGGVGLPGGVPAKFRAQVTA